MTFANVLAAGYGTEQILEFVTKTYPEIGKKIRQARNLGYDLKQIMNLIEKLTPEELRKQEAKGVYSNNNPYINADRKQRESSAFGRVGKYAPAATKLGTAYALSTMVPWGSVLTNAASLLPNEIQEPTITPSPMQKTPGQAIGEQIQQPGQVPNLAIPSKQPITQEMIDNSPEYQPEFDFLKRKDLVPKIQTMVKSGKSKEQIIEMLKKKMPMMEQEYLRTLGPGGREVDLDTKLGNIVDKFFSPGNQTDLTNQTEALQTQKQNEKIEEFPPINQKESQKGDTIITDSGEIGTIKGISGHNALIEENGKLKQVPIEQLRGQPEAIRNSKVIFDPSTIPEEDRSAALGFVLPLPDRMSIIDIFHNGKPYLYRRKDGKPFDESIIRRIIDGTDIPLTSGDTFMGAYNPEKGDSRGSANHKELVSRAQKADEPDDPTKDLIFEEIDDSYIHGYYKEFMNILRSFTKAYAAKPKKPKKG